MNLIVSPKAGKQLKKLPKTERSKVIRKLELLEENPLLGKPLTGQLKHFYSLRAWPYRILYQILKDQNTIRIDTIEHRQGAYKRH